MKFWQIYGKLNFCDTIYISGFASICDIFGYSRFSKGRFFADYLNISVLLCSAIYNLQENYIVFIRAFGKQEVHKYNFI